MYIIMFFIGIQLWLVAMNSFGAITNHQTSNQTSSSATISWISADSVDVCIYYGLTSALGDSVNDYTVDDIHLVQLTELQSDTTYYYAIRSGAEYDNNGGIYYTFRTTEIGAGIPYGIYGTVCLSDSTNPAPRAISIITVKGSADNHSLPLSSLTDASGVWYINLGNLKDSITNDVYSCSSGDTMYINIWGGNEGETADTIIIGDTSPQDCGLLYLDYLCDCEPGNANDDATINIFDITYLISYLYLSGPAPVLYELCNGDPNNDCTCNIFDITYLISFLYLGGPLPCTCEDWLTACGPPLRK